jgi:hypothetical protein
VYKSGFLVSTSPKETGNPLFYTQDGAFRPKTHYHKCTQKHIVLGVFGYFPKISKRPRAKSIRVGVNIKGRE